MIIKAVLQVIRVRFRLFLDDFMADIYYFHATNLVQSYLNFHCHLTAGDLILTLPSKTFFLMMRGNRMRETLQSPMFVCDFGVIKTRHGRCYSKIDVCQ